MSMFTNLATKEEVSKFITGTEEGALPENVEILISRASEFITIGMRNNFNQLNVNHVECAKLATCAQIQDWIEREVSAVSDDTISSYSLSELSITYANVEKYKNKLCIAAVRYLNHQGLLYKGLR